MSSSFFLAELNNASTTLLFAGQSTPWQRTLESLSHDSDARTIITQLCEASDSYLSPVRMSLATMGLASLDFFSDVSRPDTSGAGFSIPGILATQLAAVAALESEGFTLGQTRFLGHSQGVLGVAASQAWARGDRPGAGMVFAMARLIGAAAQQAVAREGIHSVGEASPMLSVRKVPAAVIEEMVAQWNEAAPAAGDGPISIALRNGGESFVLSGAPTDLATVRALLEERSSVERAAREAKQIGGTPLSPVFDYLCVDIPFHSSLMVGAFEQVQRWAQACGLDSEENCALARAVLIDPVDWVEQIRGEVAAGVRWLVDVGPGSTLASFTAPLLHGQGVGIVEAGSAEDRDRFLTIGWAPPAPADWSTLAPSLITLPDGRTVMDTAFSRLTGRSPVLLAGMTPTTVDPEIVAAAANAGYWAELAGGGQVTEEVYMENLASLREQLEPGVSAQFNSMFLDRYLWNLQFGSQRIVSRSRAQGAPIDGVVVSAGIPEGDEAAALVTQLRGDGFPWVAFKPGTVDQILQVVAIATQVAPTPVIVQVEDGHSGGHHSWEDLDELLLATYAQLRAVDNVVLCAGGGIGTPERAADYLSGQWALAYGRPLMPVDGVLIGTAAMTVKEARTSEEVKQRLVDTPGIDAHSLRRGWVGVGASEGGMTSGLSHLRADMHEVDNAAAAAARLIADLGSDASAVQARREEIIEVLGRTAKPYFGDLAEMTYAQWVERFADLSYPWVDPTWTLRFHDLLQRVEARLAPVDHGTVETLFPTVADVEDAPAAVARVLEAYPAAHTTFVTAIDQAWFPTLCRSYPKPMPFVPVLDDDLLRWWGQDGLWQAQDARYSADSVRIIPGPVSVAGIDRVNEPVAELLGRFEAAAVARLADMGVDATPAFSRLGGDAPSASSHEWLRQVPHIMWTGHLMLNPAAVLPEEQVELRDTERGVDMVIHLDTAWDADLRGTEKHAVRQLIFPLLLPTTTASGGVPVIDEESLPEHMYDMLAATAGVGSTSITGDAITAMPVMRPSELSPFGEAHWSFALPASLGPDHYAVTGAGLPAGLVPTRCVPDALLGPAWPAIYAALGSAIYQDYPVIEGLLNAVHLDHLIEFSTSPEELRAQGVERIDVVSHVAAIDESSSGRIVTVALSLSANGQPVGSTRERFAIRGRATGTNVPADAPAAGGVEGEVIDTPRSVLRRVMVTAPSDMTPFAIVSGDFNPIHTSYAAAQIAGMDAPLVHGMWLSATAQHAASASVPGGVGLELRGWTYSMYGAVELNDQVEITVERVGRVLGGGLALEVTCRVEGNIVSRATAHTTAPRTAYIYPGQGIQSRGMGLDERSKSAAADATWKRADVFTREALGFSILTIVRDNPTEITVRGVTHRHPEGVLNLTQFTQVALATLAIAQTERLREEGALVDDAAFAGHSLGEYDALAAYAQVFPLETVLDLVFHRGSTMHALVGRDENGASNYRMGALRPSQFGITHEDVEDYVASIAQASGEFLQIVNYNLAGQQYSVAGTVAGLEALAADAAERTARAGGKGAFMYVPGIDVPFHSTVLRDGVADFRERLDERIPAEVDPALLVGRYIPNLVARPFELTRSFVEAICEVVPARALQDLLDSDAAWEAALAAPAQLTRLLLIELLSWQFASPVRWIETQDVLLRSAEAGGLGVDEVVEVGLGAAPTLANMAARTLQLPAFTGRAVTVLNAQRDEARVLRTDVAVVEEAEEEAPPAPTAAPTASEAAPAADVAPAAPAPVAAPAAPAGGGVSGADVADLPFKASDAIRALFALAAKIRLDEVGERDTTETLTNGVSSRRNQLLMDMSAELGLSSIDGAAEADVATLGATVDRLAKGYAAFGPVLGDQVKDRVRKLFGGAGAKATRIAERVTGTWQLGAGWVDHVTAEILLGTREGASTREGELATLTTAAPANAAGVDELIDTAVRSVGQRHGISVTLPQAGGGAGGGVVDSAALDAFAEKVTGVDGVLASTARHILTQLGHSPVVPVADSDDEAARVVEAVAAELGSKWVDMVAPAFDARKAVLIDDRWASAREDLARLWVDGALSGSPLFAGAGQAVADQAAWWAKRAEKEGRQDLVELYRSIQEQALTSTNPDTTRYANDVAVVTGMTPTSIGGAVVARLLAGGATVIATSSRVDARRLGFAKRLYREHAAPGARLWLVPANLSSYRDVDALADWVGSPYSTSVGGSAVEVKPALTPTLFFPFAAPQVSGTMADSGAQTENQMRLLLWSVERSIVALAAIGADTDVDHRLHVVLPGSPNRGIFGGDGAYAESKASFDAILNKWHSEPVWSSRVSFAHPRIGWVRGTGLMGGNDPMVAAVESTGVRTWSTEEMADQLMDLCSTQTRQAASSAPIEADLTGGLGSGIDLVALRKQALENAPAQVSDAAAAHPTVDALPSPTLSLPTHIDPAQWGQVNADLHETVVIVGHGEVGPWGSARTRLEAELGIQSDGSVELTPAGVLELAWMTGLLTWSDTPVGGWYDADDQLVPEAQIFERYRDEVVARSGVRFFTDDGPLHDGWSPELTTIFLDRDISFTVDSHEEALSYQVADPEFTVITEVDGEWQVTRKSGGQARVPRRATISRRIGGQFPTNFDPARWGIPASMIDSIDRIAVWNLVTAVDAFVSAGFSPTELLQIVHPADVASTQGTGFGGMTSMHRLFVDRFLGEEFPQDILQETLPNVVAAHTMQSYIGGYGSMINPVSACATAAVSIEEGVDKIHCGKADFVVAGAIDDIQVESVVGFGSMNATANSNDMLAQGISERFVSRANDRRRGGFVESQGGGTVLLTRASVALDMGLPVLGVVAFAQTFSDGFHTSIPAPGIGALASARGGKASRLAKQLGAYGVSIDDVAVVSKHDTSTNANDPNESDLHTRIGHALGRDAGNPLFVISQKTLTGHAKGGACVFQVGGLTQLFQTGVIPANASLDCVDDAMAAYPHLVWLRSPLDLGARGPIKAAFATSLGFGHVSSLVALVHPAAFEALVVSSAQDHEAGLALLAQWRERSDARLVAAHRHREAGMMGHRALFEAAPARRLPTGDVLEASGGDAHEVEAAMLLDPNARLSAEGVYTSTPR